MKLGSPDCRRGAAAGGRGSASDRSAPFHLCVIVGIFLVMLTLGCQSSNHVAGNIHQYSGPGRLRNRNASEEDFFDVVFQGNRFGDIKKGELTEYQAAAVWPPGEGRITLLPGDYPQEEISLRRANFAGRTRYIWVDYPGRFVSGPHPFTFVLTLHNDYGQGSKHLDIAAVKDD